MITVNFDNVINTTIRRLDVNDGEYNYQVRIITTEGEVHIVAIRQDGTMQILTEAEE